MAKMGHLPHFYRTCSIPSWKERWRVTWMKKSETQGTGKIESVK